MTAETTPIQAVAYAAKSTADRHRSIPDQRADVREMASSDGLPLRRQDPLIDAREWTIVGEFADEGFSAYSGNRGPDLDQAIRRAKELARESGEPVMLIAQAHDRFALGAGDQPGAARALIEIWHDLRRANVWLRTVEDDGDLRDSPSVANIGHRAYMDSLRKSKSVSKGMRRRAERGKLAGGPRPYAYRWVGPSREKSLEVVPGEAEVVRRIFAETIAGVAQMALARALNAERIPSATGVEWTQSSVRNVLRNPIYVGRIRHAGAEYDGAHEAIIDEETFRSATEIRESQARTKRTTPNSKGSLRGSPPGSNNGGGRWPKGNHVMVKGLLRCGTCGSAMIPRTAPNRRGGLYQVYLCDGRRRNGLDYCYQEPIDRATIDGAILRELSARYLDLEQTRDRLRVKRAFDAARVAETLAQAEKEASRAADALARVKRDYMTGAITADEWHELRADLLEEQAAADAAVTRARDRSATSNELSGDPDEETLRRLAELRAAVLGGIENAPDLNALRNLLRQLFIEVRYLAPGHPRIGSHDVRMEGAEAGSGAYLMPTPKPDAVTYPENPNFDRDWERLGLDQWDDLTPAERGRRLAELDAMTPDVEPIVHRVPFPFADQVSDSEGLTL